MCSGRSVPICVTSWLAASISWVCVLSGSGFGVSCARVVQRQRIHQAARGQLRDGFTGQGLGGSEDRRDNLLDERVGVSFSFARRTVTR